MNREESSPQPHFVVHSAPLQLYQDSLFQEQAPKEYIEVKRGQSSPLEFAWVNKQLPKTSVQVVCTTPFQTDTITGVTLEQFLLARE